uniref:Uncharacterized protein n=1 Tax=Marseillevirus LCMAC101 TaxID=2506602 RepID=A0A481YSA0_9VIRU|nr:MAG: hypothetical protein LCMAC101_06830 [Marseillevirus LCMAC101]
MTSKAEGSSAVKKSFDLYRILRDLRLYSWRCLIRGNPTTFSCYGLSEDDARLRLSDFFGFTLPKTFELYQKQLKDLENDSIGSYYARRNSLNLEMKNLEKTLDVDLFIGCSTTSISDMSIEMEIEKNGEEMTLGDLLKLPADEISGFHFASVKSCLDG